MNHAHNQNHFTGKKKKPKAAKRNKNKARKIMSINTKDEDLTFTVHCKFKKPLDLDITIKCPKCNNKIFAWHHDPFITELGVICSTCKADLVITWPNGRELKFLNDEN